jgi:undecaprenyl-diphosphatase
MGAERSLGTAKQAIVDFDAAVDTWVQQWRGHPTLDRVMYAASELGDFSLIWHLIGTTRALAPDRRAEDAVRVATIVGLESLFVNGVVKSLVGRHRPVWEEERPRKLRKPRTSSFPSGHASSAATAFGVLARRDDPLWPLYAVAAVTVATSRVYVKVHHASDVIAGAALGAGLALVARRLWPASK